MTTPANENHPHSIFGASKASMWRACSGSVGAIEEAKKNGDIPKDSSTKYSAEGGVAHDWGYRVLTGKCGIEELPDDFRQHITGYVNHCREIEAQGGSEAEIMNEAIIPLFYRPQDRGTVDHAVFCPTFLHFTDLKYGAGIAVSALENDQLLIYVISLIEEKEIMEGYEFPDDLPVYITVYQPRHYTFTGDPDTWEITVGDLRQFAIDITKDYEKAKARSDTFNPSEKGCQFCEIVCTERIETSFGGLPPALNVMEDFDFETDTKEDLPKAKDFDRSTLTPGQVAWVCRNGGTIKKIIEDVTGGEIKRLQEGGEIRQMKLVTGKLGNRAWVDEESAETFIRGMLGVSEAYKPRQLITAPQALSKAKGMKGELSTISLLKLGMADAQTTEKAKTECLIHRPEGKPKLVSIDDPAEALDFSPVEDDFNIEE